MRILRASNSSCQWSRIPEQVTRGRRTMKRSRFTEEQIIGIPREQEAEGATADVCRKHGISGATFCKWMATFGGMDVSEARRQKVLEDENAKLKRLLAKAMLDNTMLKDIATSARLSAAGGTVPVTIVGPLAPPCGFRLTSSSCEALTGCSRPSRVLLSWGPVPVVAVHPDWRFGGALV